MNVSNKIDLYFTGNVIWCISYLFYEKRAIFWSAKLHKNACPIKKILEEKWQANKIIIIKQILFDYSLTGNNI